MATLHTFWIAVIWGTPTPATTLVVQILPGPIPTFTPLAPAATKSLQASSVTIFPAIISILGNAFLIFLTASNILDEWPCALSTTITSTADSTSLVTLSR